MKITNNWVAQHFPFLSDLLAHGGISGRKKVTLKINTGKVDVPEPFHNSVNRTSASGKISGSSFTHSATIDMAAPTSLEVQDGSSVSPGCYYAVLDVLESYGHRELTIWFNRLDLTQATQELKNQLTELHLQLAEPAASY